MSYVATHEHTNEALGTWAGGAPLQVFQFYFWRPGDILQKSITGLQRSWLHQVCERNPSMIEQVLDCIGSHHDTSIVWTEAKLTKALRHVLAILCDIVKVAVFIDGLDEFEGGYDDLLDVLLHSKSTKNMKLCLSSRPEVTMVYRLSKFQPVRLQDLNYEAILAFVRGKLSTYEELERMAYEIAQAAEGVFLWAVLVTHASIEGFKGGDDREMLMNRLTSLSKELDDLLRHMLEQVSEVNRDALLLCMHAIESWEGSEFFVKHGDWPSVKRASIALATAALYD